MDVERVLKGWSNIFIWQVKAEFLLKHSIPQLLTWYLSAFLTDRHASAPLQFYCEALVHH